MLKCLDRTVILVGGIFLGEVMVVARGCGGLCAPSPCSYRGSCGCGLLPSPDPLFRSVWLILVFLDLLQWFACSYLLRSRSSSRKNSPLRDVPCPFACRTSNGSSRVLIIGDRITIIGDLLLKRTGGRLPIHEPQKVRPWLMIRVLRVLSVGYA